LGGSRASRVASGRTAVRTIPAIDPAVPRSPGTQEQVAEFRMDRGRVTVFLKARNVHFTGSGMSVFVDLGGRVAAMSPST